MDMTQLTLIGIIPTTLIVLGGLLVMKTGKPETAERRFLLYLFAVSIGLLLIVAAAGLFSTDTNREPGFMAANIISPSILGVLALILLHLTALKGLPPRQWLAYLGIGILLIALLVVYAFNSYSMTFYVLPAALVLALIWAAAIRWQGLAVVMGVFCLLYFMLITSLANTSWFEQQRIAMPNWLLIPYGILIFAMPGIAVALAAVLVHTGLKRFWGIHSGLKRNANNDNRGPCANRRGCSRRRLSCRRGSPASGSAGPGETPWQQTFGRYTVGAGPGNPRSTGLHYLLDFGLGPDQRRHGRAILYDAGRAGGGGRRGGHGDQS